MSSPMSNAIFNAMRIAMCNVMSDVMSNAMCNAMSSVMRNVMCIVMSEVLTCATHGDFIMLLYWATRLLSP